MILLLFLQIASAQVYFENLDEEIRYQEDPYYASYLDEKAKKLQIEKKAQADQRKTTAKSLEKEEAQRLAFIKTRNEQQEVNAKNDKKSFEKYVEKRESRRQKIEKSREKFIKKRDEDSQTRMETRQKQLAKMQQEVSRLPANYFDVSERPRVPKNKRKFP